MSIRTGYCGRRIFRGSRLWDSLLGLGIRHFADNVFNLFGRLNKDNGTGAGDLITMSAIEGPLRVIAIPFPKYL